MSKKTVAQLDQEVQQLKKNASNVQLSQFTLWGWEQVAAILEQYNRYGELVKMEITGENLVDKIKYHIVVWHYPLMNVESRKKARGDFYEGLRQTKEHI